MKKILAVVMVLSMIMAPFMTISVGAAEGLNLSETAGYEDYYSIKTADDIALIASYVADDTEGTNKYYIENDIVLAATTNASYIPEFKGTLDGGNHKITISINTAVTATPVGFIGTTTGVATIKNVVTDGSVNQAANNSNRGSGAAALIGKNTAQITIEDCTNYADVTSYNSVGGFMGFPTVGTSSVSNNYTRLTNYGNISANGYTNAGGITSMAAAYTNTSYCQNYGDIVGSFAGGIAGTRLSNWSCNIRYCQNFGDVTAGGYGYAGGIVGFLAAKGTTITGCLNAGTITEGTGKLGGITCARATYTGMNVKDCINVGKVNYTGSSTVTVYSLVGIGTATSDYATVVTVTNSVYLAGTAKDADVNATSFTDATVANALTTLNTTTADLFEIDETVDFGYPTVAALDLTTKNVTFSLGEGSVDKDATEKVIYGLPYQFTIKAPANYAPAVVKAGDTELVAVTGTTYEVEALEDTTITATYTFDIDSVLNKDGNGYYEINNKTDFAVINEYPGEKYILKSDIVLDPITTTSYLPTFNGELDGNDKSVTININYDGNEGLGTALISKLIEGANIHDLTIKGSVTALNTRSYVAALAGMYAPDANVNKTLYITNVTNEADVKAAGGVAGIVSANGGGWNWETLELRNIVNKGNITAVQDDGILNSGRLVAGIVMTVYKNTKLYNCVNYGTVTAEDFSAGGIYNNGGYGAAAQTKIYGCMNFGKIDGKSQVGGIGATLYGHDIQDCVNAGEIVITNPIMAGGIVGYCSNGSNSQIVDCINVGKFTYSGSDPVNPIGGQGVTQDGSRIVKISGNFYLDNNALYSDAINSTKFSTLDAALTALNTDTANGYTYAAAPVDVEFPYPVISAVTLATKNVTFNVTGNGSVDLGASAKVVMGTSVDFKVTANDGNYIETVKLAGKPLAGYVTNATLTTPSVTDDITYVITFAEGALAANTVTTSLVNPDVLVENGAKVKYMFARLAKGFGEFGMLITTDESATMEVGEAGVLNAVGVAAPDVLGQFGIRFVGGAEDAETDLPAGTYYVRPYAKYGEEYSYGTKVSFVVE